MCLAQYKVANNSNEIPASPVILNWLEIEDCIITIDAIGCQRSIAEQIRGKKQISPGIKRESGRLVLGHRCFWNKHINRFYKPRIAALGGFPN